MRKLLVGLSLISSVAVTQLGVTALPFDTRVDLPIGSISFDCEEVSGLLENIQYVDSFCFHAEYADMLTNQIKLEFELADYALVSEEILSEDVLAQAYYNEVQTIMLFYSGYTVVVLKL